MLRIVSQNVRRFARRGAPEYGGAPWLVDEAAAGVIALMRFEGGDAFMKSV